MNSQEGQTWQPGFRSIFEEGWDDSVGDAVQLLLRLASGEADNLSGRFISVGDDLSVLLRHPEEISDKGLYTLRVHALQKSGS